MKIWTSKMQFQDTKISKTLAAQTQIKIIRLQPSLIKTYPLGEIIILKSIQLGHMNETCNNQNLRRDSTIWSLHGLTVHVEQQNTIMKH